MPGLETLHHYLPLTYHLVLSSSITYPYTTFSTSPLRKMVRKSDISRSILSIFASSTAAPVHNNGSLSWESCPDTLGYSTRIQCAHLEVPMDWDDPTKGNVTLGIVRLPALESEVSAMISWHFCELNANIHPRTVLEICFITQADRDSQPVTISH